MKMFALSDVGKVRTTNQDTYAFDSLDVGHFAAICDGMGGSNSGNIASEMAISTLIALIKERLSGITDGKMIKSILRNCVRDTNEKLYEMSKGNKSLEGMGTTLVLAYVVESVAYVVNIGDSRAYIISEDTITKITTDHSIVEEMLKNGHITEQEAKNHPKKNIITMALGPDHNIIPSLYVVDIKPKDILLLCSDGLTNMLDDMEIKDIVLTNKNQQIVKSLVEAANANGGTDNITVVTMFS